MDNVTLDINLLTEKEKEEYREANLKIAEIITKVEFRQMENRKRRDSKAIPLKIEYRFNPPVWVCALFKDTGLCRSLNEAKKLIKQKGLRINKKVIIDVDYIVSKRDAVNGELSLQRGKKQFYKISVK